MSDQVNEDDEVRVFVGDSSGPEDYVGFFEDDGETGYLYVSDRKKNEVVQHLQIYNSSRLLNIDENDVQVVWSKDGKKCGVSIWGGMRGIIDIGRKVEGRAFVESRSTPPIDDPVWLEGFPN
jgi:hypothetical protein